MCLSLYLMLSMKPVGSECYEMLMEIYSTGKWINILILNLFMWMVCHTEDCGRCYDKIYNIWEQKHYVILIILSSYCCFVAPNTTPSSMNFEVWKYGTEHNRTVISANLSMWCSAAVNLPKWQNIHRCSEKQHWFLEVWFLELKKKHSILNWVRSVWNSRFTAC